MSGNELVSNRSNEIPSVEVLVAGKPLPESFRVNGADIELTTESRDTGSACIQIFCSDNVTGEPDTKSLLSAFPLMGAIIIKLGYEGKNETVFEGVIFERVLNLKGFMLGSLTVTALDIKALFRLNNTHICHTVHSYSELLNSMATKYDLSCKPGKLPRFNSPAVFNQNGLSDFDFLADMADGLDCEFFVLKKDLYFREAKEAAGALTTLGRGVIFSAEYTTSLKGLFAEAHITAYDIDKGKTQSVTCSSVGVKTGSGRTAAEIFKKAGHIPAARRSFYSAGLKDLKESAESLLQRNSTGLSRLIVTTDGVPGLLPGSLIKFEDMSGGADNTYYIKAARHNYGNGVYQTELVCISNTISV